MNSSSRSLRGEIVLVAVIGDLDAAHQFHHEIRPARVRRAGVQHLGDVRMIHHRQRLPLRLEPGDDLLGVHAQLDDLQRHAAAHRLGSARPYRPRRNRLRRFAPAACNDPSVWPTASSGTSANSSLIVAFTSWRS